MRVFGAPLAAPGAPAGSLRKPPKRERKASAGGGGASEELVSPLQGTVLRVAVEQGAEVEEGALVCVVEAMKMENEIAAHRAGTVEALNVSEGACACLRRRDRDDQIVAAGRLTTVKVSCYPARSRRPGRAAWRS